jgi:hypothetical protein
LCCTASNRLYPTSSLGWTRGVSRRRYLEVSGINELARDLKAKNICTSPVATLRCAIYTRVSTDHCLAQDFNSLAANGALLSVPGALRDLGH